MPSSLPRFSDLRALRRPALALLACLGFASALRGQANLQEWTFDNPGTVHTLAAFGWTGWGARNDEPAVNYTGTLSFNSTQPRLGRIKNIKSADGTTVLAACTGTGETAKNRFVAVVEFPPLSLADDRLGAVRWSQASTNLDSVRLLVRSGEKWYASARSFTNVAASGVGTVTNAQLHALDLAGPEGLASIGWHPVSFGDQIPIDVASAPVPQTLPHTISGIGFLVEFAALHDRRVYLDNVFVGTSIP